MKAIWRGQVIAESDRTLEVHGYRYFPRETVRMDLLRLSPKTTSDLDCPHGVQFYDLAADAARSERAAVVRGAARGDEADRSLDRLLERCRDRVISFSPPHPCAQARVRRLILFGKQGRQILGALQFALLIHRRIGRG